MKKGFMKILIETSPLSGAHAIRGIGTYTRLLVEQLETLDEVEVKRTATLDKGEKFQADITHYPFFDLFFATLPIGLSKKTVVTIHDVIPLRYPEYYPPGIKGKLRFEKQKLALKTVSAIITDSHSSKLDIVEYLGVPEDKVFVVYLAANPSLVAQKDEIIRRIGRKYKLPKEYVLYVGDINYNKNIPQLIKMLKFLPERVHLVCVGRNFIEQDIPEWRWIETQLALSDVSKRVHFLTDVRGDATDDLSAIYSGSLCYLQPSLYEGFGLPILEAMQCRTAVVSTNTSSLPEVGGEFAVYTGTKAEELAEGVEEVLEWSKTKREQKIREAYAWSQKFSWKKTALDTLAVYREVLGLK